ncbi:hypothetical protein LCGC14_2796290 [marine sediment metagenome]|uniref:Uncharacterized protein n=1 Tax=marine sediment metagenome TaxID=412755 RepID=A0A0F8YNZ3_9ZZZZ
MSEQLHRKTYRVDLLWQLPREVEFLQRLASYNGFPRVKGWDEEAVWMTNCGRSIKEAVKGGLSVGQVEDQLSVLLFVLEREGIHHRDITANNLLWHPERGLCLIDFGWSVWFEEKDTPTPVPHVMRPWMCDHTDVEQAEETLKGLRGNVDAS